jgi:hypothetical protein
MVGCGIDGCKINTKKPFLFESEYVPGAGIENLNQAIFKKPKTLLNYININKLYNYKGFITK